MLVVEWGISTRRIIGGSINFNHLPQTSERGIIKFFLLFLPFPPSVASWNWNFLRLQALFALLHCCINFAHGHMCLFLNAAVVFHHRCLYVELDMEEWVPVHPILVGKLLCYQKHALQRTEILIEIEIILYFHCLKWLIITFSFVKNGILQICLCWQFKTLSPHLRFQICRQLTKLWRIMLAID